VLRHHLEDLGKIHQGDEGGIEAHLLGRIGEGGTRQIRILGQPIIDVENFLRIGRGGGDLRQQRIGIKSDGGQELVEFFWSWNRVLRGKKRRELLQNDEGNQ